MTSVQAQLQNEVSDMFRVSESWSYDCTRADLTRKGWWQIRHKLNSDLLVPFWSDASVAVIVTHDVSRVSEASKIRLEYSG